MAYAIQENLEFDCEPTVWPQGVFQPSNAALVDLYAFTRQAQFAVFVFTPDDVIHMRGSAVAVVRDNVIFELGLFVGALGPRRCFFVVPYGQELHLPSDLIGVEPLRYVANRRDGNLRAALGPACNRIRQALRAEPAALPAAASTSPSNAQSPVDLANQLIENWNSEPLISSRLKLREGIPFHISEDEGGEATTALSTVFAFLNSVADGVISGQVDEEIAADEFRQAIVEVWTRSYNYFVPADIDPEEVWLPLPPVGQIAARWASIA